MKDELDPNLRSQKEQNQQVIQITTSALTAENTEQEIESLESSPEQNRQSESPNDKIADSSPESTTQFFRRRLSSLIKTFAGSENKDDNTLTRSATDLSITGNDASPDTFDSSRRRSQSLRYPLRVVETNIDQDDDLEEL